MTWKTDQNSGVRAMVGKGGCMRRILLRFLLIWLLIFLGLVLLSFVMHWGLFVQYFSAMMEQLIGTIVVLVILIGAILYMIGSLFR